MSPRRKTRGTEYYGHGYDDHDEHSVGFPSIEGALMAISFLTFAVYLVRLVMVRNISFFFYMFLCKMLFSCHIYKKLYGGDEQKYLFVNFKINL